MGRDDMLKDYLSQNVAYDMQMLNFTGQNIFVAPGMMLWAPNPLMLNALYESFSIHARSMIDFLCGRRPPQFPDRPVAQDYVLNFKYELDQHLLDHYASLHNQQLHLGQRRIAEGAGKLSPTDMFAVYNWVRAAFEAFVEALPAQYKVVQPA